MPKRNPKATCLSCWIGKPRKDATGAVDAVTCQATMQRPDRVKRPDDYCPWHPDYTLADAPKAPARGK